MSRPIEYLPATAHHVLIVVNPTAGSGANRDAVQELSARLRSDGWQVETTSDLDRLAERAAPGVDPTLRAVVVAGGDGTVAAVVNRTHADTPIAILPQGTENLLGKYLRLLVAPVQLCQAITHGATVRLDAGLAGNRVFLLMAGCGFDADVVQRLHARRTGNIRHLSYVKPIVDSIRNYQYPELRVSCEPPPTPWSDSPSAPTPAGGEGRVSFVARWLFIINLPRYAGGLRFVPNAVGTDGLLDVCGFERGSLWHGLRYLRGVVAGRHLAWPDCCYVQTRRVRIESAEHVPYQLDGDPGGTLPLEITALPARVRLIATESWAQYRGFRHPPRAAGRD